jgi:hypothetical protein
MDVDMVSVGVRRMSAASGELVYVVAEMLAGRCVNQLSMPHTGL